MNKSAVAIKRQGLIAIVRGLKIQQAVQAAEAMYRGGVRIIESAYDQRDPDKIENNMAMIRALRAALPPDVLLGAGTVLNTQQTEAACTAGADFIFSPNVNFGVIAKTKELGMTSIPGAFTPSEIMTAVEAGADIVKLFPVTAADIGYVVNVSRPLSHVPFICVGGTNETSISAFFKAGAIGVGTGISILNWDWIKAERYDKIESAAKAHVDAVRRAQREAGIDFL